eukprot:jgi/Bigna1/77469/fgenesh1_pg.48_\
MDEAGNGRNHAGEEMDPDTSNILKKREEILKLKEEKLNLLKAKREKMQTEFENLMAEEKQLEELVELKKKSLEQQRELHKLQGALDGFNLTLNQSHLFDESDGDDDESLNLEDIKQSLDDTTSSFDATTFFGGPASANTDTSAIRDRYADDGLAAAAVDYGDEDADSISTLSEGEVSGESDVENITEFLRNIKKRVFDVQNDVKSFSSSSLGRGIKGEKRQEHSSSYSSRFGWHRASQHDPRGRGGAAGSATMPGVAGASAPQERSRSWSRNSSAITKWVCRLCLEENDLADVECCLCGEIRSVNDSGTVNQLLMALIDDDDKRFRCRCLILTPCIRFDAAFSGGGITSSGHSAQSLAAHAWENMGTVEGEEDDPDDDEDGLLAEAEDLHAILTGRARASPPRASPASATMEDGYTPAGMGPFSRHRRAWASAGDRRSSSAAKDGVGVPHDDVDDGDDEDGDDGDDDGGDGLGDLDAYYTRWRQTQEEKGKGSSSSSSSSSNYYDSSHGRSSPCHRRRYRGAYRGEYSSSSARPAAPPTEYNFHNYEEDDGAQWRRASGRRSHGGPAAPASAHGSSSPSPSSCSQSDGGGVGGREEGRERRERRERNSPRASAEGELQQKKWNQSCRVVALNNNNNNNDEASSSTALRRSRGGGGDGSGGVNTCPLGMLQVGDYRRERCRWSVAVGG